VSGKMCPELSFSFILHGQPQKVKCILHYFHRLSKAVPSRFVEFYRNVLPKKRFPVFDAGALLENKTPLAGFEVKGRPHMIEDAEGCMQADFANEWIGGGVLHAGCVQEEILFMEKPECLISLLVCNVMRGHESITIVGAERFSTHKGYARSFQWAGDFVDKQPIDSKQRLSNVIIAYDALVARFCNQFSEKNMLREIIKTHVAVAIPNEVTRGVKAGEEDAKTSYKFDTFATGNWGCGAFGGDIPLKAMLQWIACSLAGKHIRYFDFGDRNAQGLKETTQYLLKAGVHVGWLWDKLLRQEPRRQHLFNFLQESAAKLAKPAAKADGHEATKVEETESVQDGKKSEVEDGKKPEATEPVEKDQERAPPSDGPPGGPSISKGDEGATRD